MGDEADWFGEAVEQAFDSPQARMVQSRLAAARAEEEAKERALKERLRASRPSPVDVKKDVADFKAVAEGRRPQYTASPISPVPPVTKKPPFQPAPRPGSTGAITPALAIEALVKKVKESSDPRGTASELLAILTKEIVKAADEADPITE